MAQARLVPEAIVPPQSAPSSLARISKLEQLVCATLACEAPEASVLSLCASVLAKQLRLAAAMDEVGAGDAQWILLSSIQQLLQRRRLAVPAFLDAGGMEHLFALPVATRGVKAVCSLWGGARAQHEELFLQCIEQLLDGAGAGAAPPEQRLLACDALLRLPTALPSLALLVSSRGVNVKRQALRLLTLSLADSPAASGAALSEALDRHALVLRVRPQLGPSRRYAPLVQLINFSAESPAMQAAGLRLLNVLGGRPPSLVERCWVRRDLRELGFTAQSFSAQLGQQLQEGSSFRGSPQAPYLPQQGHNNPALAGPDLWEEGQLREQAELLLEAAERDEGEMEALCARHESPLDSVQSVFIANRRLAGELSVHTWESPAHPCEIRRSPLDCHCDSGANSQF
jgi:hypothetical protein